MFLFDFHSTSILIDDKVIFMFGLAFIFSFLAIFKNVEGWQNKLLLNKPKNTTVFAMTGISILLFVLSLSSIASSGFSPFVYFRF